MTTFDDSHEEIEAATDAMSHEFEELEQENCRSWQEVQNDKRRLRRLEILLAEQESIIPVVQLELLRARRLGDETEAER